MRRPLPSLLVLLLLHFDAGVYCQTAVPPLRTPADRPIDIQHIRLDLRVDLSKKTVEAQATLRFRTLRPLASISLDAVGFKISRVTLASGEQDEKPVKYTHTGHKLLVDLDPAWPAGQAATLHVYYRIQDPGEGLHFHGPTTGEPNTPLCVWSQGEAELNRYWFPCLDQPNQRQTTELVVTVADGLEVLSNGKLIERKTNPDKTVTFHWRQEKTHAAYLVTLVVGAFDVVREEWQGLPLLYYVPPGRKAEVAPTFGRTPAMLAFFSERFGIPYPWEKYAQIVVFDFGPTFEAMENTSATTLQEPSLHDARAALDDWPDVVVAHELAHQWWGNLVTCKDWAHTWLNEGFASYAEILWTEHRKGSDEAAYALWRQLDAALARGHLKPQPMVDRRYTDPDQMFDARSYEKGSWVVHMLRRRLGEDKFWKGVRRYGTDFRFRCADTTDLRKALERESELDLERFFYDWTERGGNPVLTIETTYAADTKQARVVVVQTQNDEPFHFPLTMVFHLDDGKVQTVQRDITEMKYTFSVSLPGRPTLVDVDPEQTVLAEIKETKDRDLWVAQLAKAPGVASRLRAVRHLAGSKALPDREQLARALEQEKFWGVQVEIARSLDDADRDTGRETLLRGLRDAHPKVRRACAEQLTHFAGDQAVCSALRALLAKGDPSYFVEQAALTSYGSLHPGDTAAVLLPWLDRPSYQEVLRRAALQGLARVEDLSVVDKVAAWAQRGKPHACRVAALSTLRRLALTPQLTGEQRQRILTVMTASLTGESADIRRLAVSALHEMGDAAKPSLKALEAVAEQDGELAVRAEAKTAVAELKTRKPATPDQAKLQAELDRLKQENTLLRLRVEELQQSERKRR